MNAERALEGLVVDLKAEYEQAEELAAEARRRKDHLAPMRMTEANALYDAYLQAKHALASVKED